jgi:hypothetical protein
VHNVSPFLIDILADMQLPVDSLQERNFVLVNFLCIQARNLTPGACRVVAILEVLGGQNQGSQEHAASAQ